MLAELEMTQPTSIIHHLPQLFLPRFSGLPRGFVLFFIDLDFWLVFRVPFVFGHASHWFCRR
jgi:hypothetical protein